MSTRRDTVPTELVVIAVGSVRTTRKGNVYLTCDTNCGKVAFWGTEGNRRNIETIRALQLPAHVRCDCIPSNWAQHVLWIPEGADVMRLAQQGEDAAASSEVTVVPEPVSADELDSWRRRLLRLLDHIEGSSPRPDGPIARITVLKKQGQIPRETAALMITLMELRNVSEHHAKNPTAAESAVARNAWAAICEWASTRGIDPERL